MWSSLAGDNFRSLHNTYKRPPLAYTHHSHAINAFFSRQTILGRDHVLSEVCLGTFLSCLGIVIAHSSLNSFCEEVVLSMPSLVQMAEPVNEPLRNLRIMSLPDTSLSLSTLSAASLSVRSIAYTAHAILDLDIH